MSKSKPVPGALARAVLTTTTKRVKLVGPTLPKIKLPKPATPRMDPKEFARAMKAVAPPPKLRIWWIPQVPMQAFHADVKTIDEAKLLLKTLAQYDLFQFENNIKPDYANAGGLQVFEDGEWTEWSNADGDQIDEVMRAA